MKAWAFKYLEDILRVATFLMALAILNLAVLGYIQGQDSTHQTLKNIKSLGEQIKNLESENQVLLKEIKINNSSIHNQINCVLNFFTKSPSTRNSSSILQPNPCIITNVSFNGTPGGSAGSTKSVDA